MKREFLPINHSLWYASYSQRFAGDCKRIASGSEWVEWVHGFDGWDGLTRMSF